MRDFHDDLLLKIFRLLDDGAVAYACRHYLALYVEHGSLTVRQGGPVPVGLKKKLTVVVDSSSTWLERWGTVDRDAQEWLDTVVRRVDDGCVIVWFGSPVAAAPVRRDGTWEGRSY